ncbi:MAG: AMP-dependent synthetase/ligase [Mycobacteriaceae bacterium]
MSTDFAAPARTLCETFQKNVSTYADKVALRTVDDSVCITWSEYGKRVEKISAGLANVGLKRGNTVAIMLTNRPEFHLIDTAVLHSAATPFSIYPTNPPQIIAHLLDDSKSRIVFCEKQFIAKILDAISLCKEKIDTIVCIDDDHEGTLSLNLLESLTSPGFNFDATWKSVQPEDLLTIVYTSGTTGLPKGVELTHANFIANSTTVDALGGITAQDRVLSYLPDAHVANRMLSQYSSLLWGVEITTLQDAKLAATALSRVRPTVFMGVPRLWIKLKAGIESSIANDSSTFKSNLANWALKVGNDKVQAELDRLPLSYSLKIKHTVADKLVLKKIRTKLGLDQIRIGVSGAAPVPPEVLLFVLSLGIPIYEAWGLSETTAVATTNYPNRIKVGSVGLPVPSAEIVLAADGELLVRGPMIMKGYRNNPEATSEVIDSQGWFSTGDIGKIDDEGFITIIDRKKELIINSSGKNMSPTHIENTILANCPLASTVVAIGDQRPFVTALFTLDPDALLEFASQANLKGLDVKTLLSHPSTEVEVLRCVAHANENLARVEQVKRFKILPDIWEPGGEFLTPTLKLKRKGINQQYNQEISSLYSGT